MASEDSEAGRGWGLGLAGPEVSAHLPEPSSAPLKHGEALLQGLVRGGLNVPVQIHTLSPSKRRRPCLEARSPGRDEALRGGAPGRELGPFSRRLPSAPRFCCVRTLPEVLVVTQEEGLLQNVTVLAPDFGRSVLWNHEKSPPPPVRVFCCGSGSDKTRSQLAFCFMSSEPTTVRRGCGGRSSISASVLRCPALRLSQARGPCGKDRLPSLACS